MNDEIKQTDKLQLKSLCAFMHSLGYTYCRGQFLGSDYSGAPIVHFNTAVKLHNQDWYFTDDGKGIVPGFHVNVLNSPFTFDSYTLNKALSAKILDRVKLQANRYGRIVCQSHKVAFYDSSYYQLFEGELV